MPFLRSRPFNLARGIKHRWSLLNATFATASHVPPYCHINYHEDQSTADARDIWPLQQKCNCECGKQANGRKARRVFQRNVSIISRVRRGTGCPRSASADTEARFVRAF